MSFKAKDQFHSKRYHIYHLTDSVNEGGMARNKAFYEKFLSLKAIQINVYSKNIAKRFWMALRTLLLLIFTRNKNLFIHQGSLLVLFPIFFMKIPFLRKLVFSLLNRAAKRNKLILEVNDLPYEQSIDLELEVHEIYKIIQDGFYSIKECHYVFASNEMAAYISSKYSIKELYINVIINGAPQLCDYSSIFTNEQWVNSEKTKFVYAGSLNKGRQIEDLLNIFSKDQHNLLIVLGNEGEWLNAVELPENIIYLGNFQEKEAHYLVSKCDIGIIPYNEDRFYYNLCFPTKVSFYLTAGLPILSTPLKELQQVFKNEAALLFVSFDKWSTVIENISKNEVMIMKESAKIIKESYSWKFLLNKGKID